MEISEKSPSLTGGNDLDKLQNAPESAELEENGNIAVIENEKLAVAEDSSAPRPIDQFFTQQARGDVLSPIKPKITNDDAAAESLDLKLEDTFPRKSVLACVQPESSLIDNTDMFDVNILEASIDSKLDPDQSLTDLMNEGATSRKRPQTEMEPAVFEVPRMPKHPHTDAPPVPEFREDSEPLIDFASEAENVFRVALPGESNNDPAEPMSFQENSQISPSEAVHGSSTFDIASATYVNDPSDGGNSSRFAAPVEAPSKAPVVAASSPETTEGGESPILSILRSIDEALDPLVRAIFPIMRRGTGLNTAFVCIPLLVASISYLYLRS